MNSPNHLCSEQSIPFFNILHFDNKFDYYSKHIFEDMTHNFVNKIIELIR